MQVIQHLVESAHTLALISVLNTPFGLAARVRDWTIFPPDAYILLETVRDLLNRFHLMFLPSLCVLDVLYELDAKLRGVRRPSIIHIPQYAE